MMGQLQELVKLVIARRSLILSMAVREVKSQYSGSFLGFSWTLIQPAVMVSVFWFVFSVGFKAKPVADVPFVVWLTAGMAPWFAFSAIVSSSAESVVQHAHLIKKTIFPSQILPVVKVVSNMVGHGAFLLLLLVLMLFNHIAISFVYIQVFYYLICLCLLALGIGYLVAALHVFARDVGQIVGVLLQVGFWATPIFWDIGIMAPDIQKILKMNPVYYIVQGYRDSFIAFIPFWERGLYSLYFWLVTILIFIAGAVVFRRLKPQFADVL
jgi:lipopolysaccharide transport system permease protein/teichoic acid transport system permease protein